jgi:hypothetical protein
MKELLGHWQMKHLKEVLGHVCLKKCDIPIDDE